MLALSIWVGAAHAACRQALILALDVSGSVDEREYALQLNGVAAALQDADVVAALLEFPEAPVHLAIFEWSAAEYQALIQDWVPLADRATIDAVADRLRNRERQAAPGATGLGAAMLYAGQKFRDGPVCWKRTLDISGDGRNNDWPVPKHVKQGGAMNGITVNGLVIGIETLQHGFEPTVGVAELTAYYRARILHGPDAFVEVALGYGEYADAMRRKLLRELVTFSSSALDVPETRFGG